jgi:hypothetical protein
MYTLGCGTGHGRWPWCFRAACGHCSALQSSAIRTAHPHGPHPDHIKLHWPGGMRAIKLSDLGCNRLYSAGHINRQRGINPSSDSTMLMPLLLILLGCVRASAIASRQGNLTCDAGTTLCGDTCVDLNTDRFNCGECGGWCAVAGNQCRDGVCGCEDGTERCGPFCANLQTDDLHCGVCDRSVSPTSDQTQTSAA